MDNGMREWIRTTKIQGLSLKCLPIASLSLMRTIGIEPISLSTWRFKLQAFTSFAMLAGASSEAITHILLIKSQMLIHLSYRCWYRCRELNSDLLIESQSNYHYSTPTVQGKLETPVSKKHLTLLAPLAEIESAPSR